MRAASALMPTPGADRLSMPHQSVETVLDTACCRQLIPRWWATTLRSSIRQLRGLFRILFRIFAAFAMYCIHGTAGGTKGQTITRAHVGPGFQPAAGF